MMTKDFEYEMEAMRRAKELNELDSIQELMANTVNDAERAELAQIYNLHYATCKKRWEDYDSRRK